MTTEPTMHKLTLRFNYCSEPKLKYEMKLYIEDFGLEYDMFEDEEDLIGKILDMVFGPVKWLHKLPLDFSTSYYVVDINGERILLTVSNF